MRASDKILSFLNEINSVCNNEINIKKSSIRDKNNYFLYKIEMTDSFKEVNIKRIKRLYDSYKNNIKVLDMPVLDTTRTEGLIGEVISDIVLQLLSYVAEQERAFIKQRQAEGIKLAKEKGKRLGKPPIEYPENWNNVYKVWKSGAITAREAMKQLNLKPTSFYKLAKKYKNN